jgi:nitrogen regulatory protein PII-like uncharacterized protein
MKPSLKRLICCILTDPVCAFSQLEVGRDSITVQELWAIVEERSKAQSQRFEDQEKAVSAALAAADKAVVAALGAAEKAVTKAEAATEERLRGMNEFRAQMADQQKTYVTVAEFSARLKSLDEKLSGVDSRQTQMLGKNEGANWLLGLGLAAGGFAIGVAGLYIAIRAKGGV